MKRIGVIEQKLRFIEKKLADIESWDIGTYEDFKKSTLLLNAVERALQVCIEVMIDVSERILALESIPPQETSADNMRKLKELGILVDENRYVDMIKFRNFIVHRYEYIEPDILYSLVKNNLKDIRAFIHDIRKNS